ncbi:MAG: hypothetical protein LBF67_04390 [Prevotellaceae bacterium]|jgi:hypothetical protein|nr:hypothetical protein [Prevotellaceae bacterium]
MKLTDALSSKGARRGAKTLCASLCLFCATLHSQAAAQELSGYVTGMPSVIAAQPSGDTWWQAMAHNRLNFGWQLSKAWRVDAGARTRFITGSEAMVDPEATGADMGWADLSWSLASGKNALLNTSVDRLLVTLEKEKWQLQLGRQRINWGQTFVWNPNDIFNTHSFFDFDYPERPGCDAFRATCYHSETASSELAVSVSHEGKTTAALLHHWSWKNIDYQLIAGEQAQADVVLGGACTGDLGGLNLRGEFSFFHPLKNFSDTATTIAASVGLDYTFGSSLMLQAEALYNNVGDIFAGSGLMGLYSAPLSAKYLSICDWNVFGQASYPVTPRLNAAVSTMYFVDVNACYAGISVDYSIAENLDFSFIAQYFSTLGNSGLSEMQTILAFTRIKYSF